MCELDPLVFLVICVAVAVVSWFNYILNRAPGSDPEDFNIGPPGMQIRCDCFFNTMIVGGIFIIAMAIMSSAFATRTELFVIGLVSYVVITTAGVYGRRMRYKDWSEIDGVLKRAMPNPPRRAYDRDSLDIFFENEDDEL
ncbi:MAG: hypothetical protein ACFFD9_04645 [Candidatus Thorarchaeota archaeon]